jgi:uncharacterized protein
MTELEDPEVGTIEVTGRFLRRDPERVVVVIHGLGGSVESGYITDALRAADAMSLSALVINCRGADRKSADFYHSGLIADLEAAILALGSATHIYLLGYSIGGHIALCYGCGVTDPRVKAIAAICSPLHLGLASDDFDRSQINVYRSHVMDGLKEIYTTAYQRRPRGLLPERARNIRKMRTWDDQIIAPRFGFASADAYYQSQSVGPKLAALKLPTLYVGARFDPMVRAEAVQPYLRGSSVTTVWDDRAGHLGFGSGFDLGQSAPLGLESQVLSWLGRVP